MKILIALLFAGLCLSSFANTKKHHAGRCSGSDSYCNSCTNCKYCKHCKRGGTCATCKRTDSEVKNSSKK